MTCRFRDLAVLGLMIALPNAAHAQCYSIDSNACSTGTYDPFAVISLYRSQYNVNFPSVYGQIDPEDPIDQVRMCVTLCQNNYLNAVAACNSLNGDPQGNEVNIQHTCLTAAENALSQCMSNCMQ